MIDTPKGISSARNIAKLSCGNLEPSVVAIGAIPEENINLHFLLELKQIFLTLAKGEPKRIDMNAEWFALDDGGLVAPHIMLVRRGAGMAAIPKAV